jgi:hypothetical protein
MIGSDRLFQFLYFFGVKVLVWVSLFHLIQNLTLLHRLRHPYQLSHIQARTRS